MEVMLQAVVVIFMLFLCSLCLFAVIVIVRDIIHENAKARRDKEKEQLAYELALEEARRKNRRRRYIIKQQMEKEEMPPELRFDIAPAPQPVEEAPAEQEAPAEVAPVDENAVTFSTYNPTLEEKYAALSTEFKRYFDDIIKHAMAKEGVKESKLTNYYDYKIGSYRVVRMMIKRGVIVCEFKFIDRDILDYANASNVRIEQSASVIKVTEAAAVGAVKDGIDLVCTQIAEDKLYKKELAREKRREKRRQEAAEAAEAEAAEPEASLV